MKTEYRIIWPDGRNEQHGIELPERSGKMYDALKKLVEDGVLGGAYMEHVRVFWDFDDGDDPHYLDMFIDEEGSAKNLPVNRAATHIYWNNIRINDPVEFNAAMLSAPTVILGPAVLFRDVVWS